MTHKRNTAIYLSLFFILMAVSACSLMLGPHGFLWPFGDVYQSNNAILNYRLYRIILSIVAGSSLAASGASLQAIFQNPLADPHLFGISGGAALGASIVIALLANFGSIMPSAGAIVGGLCAFLLMYFYLHAKKSDTLSHCLLVGVLINSVAAALITLLKTILPPQKTQSLLFWLVGHITTVEPQTLFVIIPLWIIGIASLWLIKGELEILSFGVEETKVLGINAERIIRIAIVANCILIGNVVAFAGMIGFLGLVVPHLVRLLINANIRIMLPVASLVGAIMLVIFDGVSRVSFLLLKSEIPTGALSALFLSPVFFYLLVRNTHD